jgi:hypothetical protein
MHKRVTVEAYHPVVEVKDLITRPMEYGLRLWGYQATMRDSGPEYAKGAQENTMHVHEALHINGRSNVW